LSYAQNQQYNTNNALTSGNGILIDGRVNGHPHHINIFNNKVHDCGGAGIVTIQSDYVTVNGNEVFNNAWYSPFGNSGISTWQNWRSDSNTGYKMLITNNKVYNNREYIPWVAVGKITDGNGIIVDDSRNTQNGSTLGGYTGRTLVENNVVFNNGGVGIAAYLSDHVDIVNNTAYLNNQSPEITGGQITAYSVSDAKIFNNIMHAYPGKYVNTNWNTLNVTFDYNCYLNSTLIQAQGSHDFLASNENFVNSSIADFRLQFTSPAINKGYTWTGLNSDFAGNPRPSAGKYDIGAYEYQFR
jgi:parallel beta-helix repeat protein